jgi:hypothetical protein
MLTVVITVDVHYGDVPEDISFAADWLAARAIPATFFIPSALLQSGLRDRLRDVVAMGHEVGSHTHHHDLNEMEALIYGSAQRLAFLEASYGTHGDFFGVTPRSFRAPCWCSLGQAALDELQRLGYAVDSSATPQRLSLLGSTPFSRAWTYSPRSPYYLRPGLLEVPTSTALIPAGSSTFQTLRGLSKQFLQLLLLDARLGTGRVIVLQFHPCDFNPQSSHRTVHAAAYSQRLRISHFWPRRYGGFGFKHFLKETDPERVSRITHDLVRSTSGNRHRTLLEVADQHSPAPVLVP